MNVKRLLYSVFLISIFVPCQAQDINSVDLKRTIELYDLRDPANRAFVRDTANLIDLIIYGVQAGYLKGYDCQNPLSPKEMDVERTWERLSFIVLHEEADDPFDPFTFVTREEVVPAFFPGISTIGIDKTSLGDKAQINFIHLYKAEDYALAYEGIGSPRYAISFKFDELTEFLKGELAGALWYDPDHFLWKNRVVNLNPLIGQETANELLKIGLENPKLVRSKREDLSDPESGVLYPQINYIFQDNYWQPKSISFYTKSEQWEDFFVMELDVLAMDEQITHDPDIRYMGEALMTKLRNPIEVQEVSPVSGVSLPSDFQLKGENIEVNTPSDLTEFRFWVEVKEEVDFTHPENKKFIEDIGPFIKKLLDGVSKGTVQPYELQNRSRKMGQDLFFGLLIIDPEAIDPDPFSDKVHNYKMAYTPEYQEFFFAPEMISLINPVYQVHMDYDGNNVEFFLEGIEIVVPKEYSPILINMPIAFIPEGELQKVFEDGPMITLDPEKEWEINFIDLLLAKKLHSLVMQSGPLKSYSN